jgi:hypothetical protein
MILLKKFSKLIPSYRHKTDLQIFDNSNESLPHQCYHKAVKTVNYIKRKKTLFKPFCYSVNLSFQKNFNLLTKSYVYNFKPYKKITICQTLSGQTYLLPGIENVNIGKILLSQSNILSYPSKFFCRGFITYL